MAKAEETAITIPSISTLAGEAMSVHIKSELDAEPDTTLSPSGTIYPPDVKNVTSTKLKMSQSPGPQTLPSEGSTSKISSRSPTVAPTPPTNSRKPAPSAPQLIGHLPIARENALKSFNEIPCNNYQFKSLGRSREVLESMTCDCLYEHGVDSEDDACGPYSDCINRLTQVECLPDDCRCRSFCQNQRFQKRQYANIEIVLTEMKGYGLRAEVDIPKDSFIYEYVGDVVNPSSFKKRMRDYALEGIQHFYFMMLQKDEFIDATKSGGIGRFANHSCNPNCYVAKWTVGNHVRMGIFSKRDIGKHEELTFNYNVDRYGHQAQKCYCGEPNCVGYIGGKTQTDIATMDDLYLDALGITDEEDVAELKGTKKKKGKKIDDPDFMPSVKPLIEKDVPKVVQAIRQTPSRKVLFKLLTRVQITQDQASLRQIMRLRGYSVMKNVLDDHSADLDLVELVLQCLSTWPLLNRNKVDDSQVSVPVEALLTVDHEGIRNLAQQLLDHWKTLPLYNRIPKRVFSESDEGPIDLRSSDESWQAQLKRRKQLEEEEVEAERLRYKARLQEKLREEEIERRNNPNNAVLPQGEHKPWPSAQRINVSLRKQSIQAVIASATEAAAAQEKAAAEAKAKADAAAAEKAARKKAKVSKKAMSAEEKLALREKRLMKLIGAVVVKCMSKYAKGLDRNLFKKYAKELTQVIAEKEKKSSTFKEGRLDSLPEEKVAKIKKFSKEYIAKVLRKLEKSGKYQRHSASSETATNATTSSSAHTPNSANGADVSMGGGDMNMTVEEAMDLDLDSGSDGEGDEDGEGEADDQEEDGLNGANGSSSHAHSAFESPADCPPLEVPMHIAQPEELNGQSFERLDSMEGIET